MPGNLRLAFTVPLGGKAGNEFVAATPLVDGGFMLHFGRLGRVVYKIDVRSGTQGKIVWKMDPGQQKPDRNRGVALWGDMVISVTGYDGRIIATNTETGQIVWDKKHSDNPDLEFSAAPLALRDTILIGASGGDKRACANWLAGLDPKTVNRSGRPSSSRRRANRKRNLEGQG
jgi:alcohol dehydrogenase (cytochrome c)